RMAETVCARVDATTMAHGVAARLPYLDDQLVGYATAVPTYHRSPAGSPKLLLRRAVGDLVPPELLARPATPPSLPLERWLAEGPLSAELDRAIERSALFGSGILDVDATRQLLARHRAGEAHTRTLFAVLILAGFCDGLGIDGIAGDSAWPAAAFSSPGA
ncbi:MAG: asparagine synthase-related protein, partial [Actinomycetota bacterium]